MCLQQKHVHFTCRFYPLCPQAVPTQLEFYLEQMEAYPAKAGIFHKEYQVPSDKLTLRKRRFSRTKVDMENYEDGDDLNLMLTVDLPQISPFIQTNTLKISHKLKLILQFKDEEEKNMILSFPLTVGTVPSMSTTTSHPSDVAHVPIEMDQWNTTHLTQPNHDLPSYFEVMREGMPPSPFVEDN